MRPLLLMLQTHLWQLGRLVPTRLCNHLESIGVLPLLYGASWLMTCFSADFPASFSARCDLGSMLGMCVSQGPYILSCSGRRGYDCCAQLSSPGCHN
jgi:hypothetical protein